MITDQNLCVVDNASMRESSPDYSDSIDLTLSPDIGSISDLVAVIAVHTYTAGSSDSTTINVVTSSASNLETTPKTIGTITIQAAELEARDLAGQEGGGPIVIRINPQHDRLTPPAGVTERYLGLTFTHETASPSPMTVSAYFVANYQGDAFLTQTPAGMKVL